MKAAICFEAPVGQRILRSHFMGITAFSLEDSGAYNLLWWDGKRWIDRAVPGSSNFAPCRSYKAFRRHLKKHQEQLRGYEVVLVNHFVGYNVRAFPA